jgi:hypothetical protein
MDIPALQLGGEMPYGWLGLAAWDTDVEAIFAGSH